MANITLILGTDSVSSSRVTINDNFSNINAELADIAAVLNTTNETITLAGAGAFGSLNVGSNKLIVNNTSATSNVPFTVAETLTVGADVVYSIKKIGPANGTNDLPAAGAFANSTYIVDSASISSVNLNVGDPGQEITIVSAGGTLTVSTTNVSGATSISLLDKATITVRFAENFWHIVSANHLATIQ
jgi:hypothetical protein